MQPNPALRKLGLADTDRVVIIHVDDVGSCGAANAAFAEMVAADAISSGAVMVPCPWFLDAAAFARREPKIDLGVHLTLNSEWANYRWAPISTHSTTTGLIDEEGYFHHRQPAVWANGDPEAVYIELKTQIERALAAGIDVTHIDGHMGTIVHPRFIPVYMRLAREYRLPPTYLLHGDETKFRERGLDDEFVKLAVQTAQTLESEGFLLIDHEVGMPLDNPEKRVEQVKATMAALKPGITHLYLHPCHDTPEVRAFAPDWRDRVADFQSYMDEESHRFIREQGIHVIGYRVLRDMLRAVS